MRSVEVAVGVTVRVFIIRVAILAAEWGLCFAILGWQPLLFLAGFLAVAGLLFPGAPSAWLLILLLAINSLGDFGGDLTWKFCLMLAAGHLIHVCATTIEWMPNHGRVQLRVLREILLHYLVVQIAAQLIATAVMSLITRAPEKLLNPTFGLLGGIALLALVMLVIRPWSGRASNDD